MGSRSNSGLFPDNSTTAHFRAWAQFIEDTLVATGGWQVSVETGDTPPASLAVPTASNQKMGFRVYRMMDFVPVPVVMRIDFGSSGTANIPGIWLTIGPGTNGLGVVTSPLWNGGISAAPNVSSNASLATGAFNSYGSADIDRAAICMFVQGNPVYHLCFTIERTKNPSGNGTTDGLLMVYRDGQATSNGIAHARFIANAGGVQPTAEVGLSYILTRQNPTESFGGDVGCGVISHFHGLAQQPGINFLITNTSDVSNESTIGVILYGVSRTYIQLNAFPPYAALVGANSLDSNARCLMLYS